MRLTRPFAPHTILPVGLFCAGLIVGALAYPAAQPDGGRRVEIDPTPTGSVPDGGTDALAPQPFPSRAYDARVLRVIDGDTLEARVQVWLGQEIVTRVRLAGIDAPELHARCTAERDGALAARAALARFVRDGAVTLSGVKPDKYFGRVIARVGTSDGDASAMLLGRGLARPYHGGHRRGWCS